MITLLLALTAEVPDVPILRELVEVVRQNTIAQVELASAVRDMKCPGNPDECSLRVLRGVPK